jgi:hypothetical protein
MYQSIAFLYLKFESKRFSPFLENSIHFFFYDVI